MKILCSALFKALAFSLSVSDEKLKRITSFARSTGSSGSSLESENTWSIHLNRVDLTRSCFQSPHCRSFV